MQITPELTYEEALSAAVDGDAIFLLGSGFSREASNGHGKLPDGNQLCNLLKTDLGITTGNDLSKIAQFYMMDQEKGGPFRLAALLKENFHVETYDESYNVLTKLKNFRAFTTNYDLLIEKVFENSSKEIKSQNILSTPTSSSDNLILHINGKLDDIGDSIDESIIKLTFDSYVQMFSPQQHGTSMESWLKILRDEIEDAKAIFVIGLSFSSDPYLLRLINDINGTNKCFYISHSSISREDEHCMERYCIQVIESGVRDFLIDLNKACEKRRQRTAYDIELKSFEDARFDYDEVSERVIGPDMRELFIESVNTSKFYNLNDEDTFPNLVNRIEYLTNASFLLNSNQSLIITSELGNGKSIFIQQVVQLNRNIEFYKAKLLRRRWRREVDFIITNSNKRKIAFILDSFNDYYDVIEYLARQKNNANILLICACRNESFSKNYNKLLEISGSHFNFEQGHIDLDDSLTQLESDQFNRLLANCGLITSTRVIRRHFAETILSVFETSDVKNRYITEIKNLSSSEKKILLAFYISSWLGIMLRRSDWMSIFNPFESICRSDNLSKYIQYQKSQFRLKQSSIIARSLLTSSAFSNAEKLEVALSLVTHINQIAMTDTEQRDNFVGGLRYLASCYRLSILFNVPYQQINSFHTVDSDNWDALLDYYENIKTLSYYNKHNWSFWEQYAIACLNVREYDTAKLYFDRAYQYGRRELGSNFNTYQVDNHYARYLLLRAIDKRNYETSYTYFIDSYKYLKRAYDSSQDSTRNVYFLRVATHYKDFYDVFFSRFSDEEKTVFASIISEIYVIGSNFEFNFIDNIPHIKNENLSQKLRNDVINSMSIIKTLYNTIKAYIPR